jgi:predicted CoA-binding protein
MARDGLIDQDIAGILVGTRRIAMVGASSKPYRPSNEVLGFLLGHGYHVTPVNPWLAGQSVRGRPAVSTLEEAAPLEMVDIFRNPAHVAPIVDAAIRLGARVVWMQLGVIDETAARHGREAGMTVVMDRCPVIEWRRLGLTRRNAAAVP